MTEKTLTKNEAIDIIHEVRSENSFTMGMTLDEYIDFFRKNYAKIFNVVLPHDEIEIAKHIKELQ